MAPCASITSGSSPSWPERRERRDRHPGTADGDLGSGAPGTGSLARPRIDLDRDHRRRRRQSRRRATQPARGGGYAANGTAALDAIGFAPSLEGQTLVLTGGQLTVSQDLIIDGNGDDGDVAVTIDGAGKAVCC